VRRRMAAAAPSRSSPYECAGTGSPPVILEAGYTASGIDTYGPVISPAAARRTRVCTYDRAGAGLSDAPPGLRPPAHRGHPGPGAAHPADSGPRRAAHVLVGDSCGGMITGEFAAGYHGQVAGMVLLDASSEPEVAVYDRLRDGPWIDGTVQPAPSQRINIGATVRRLARAPSLGRMPLIVVTAGILQDRWRKPSRSWRPGPRPGSPYCRRTRSMS
jgi:pimeloyl-ACP methyl ester carboxylesterase